MPAAQAPVTPTASVSTRNRGEIAASKSSSATCFAPESCSRRLSFSGERVSTSSATRTNPPITASFAASPPNSAPSAGVIQSVKHGRGRGLIQLGLLLLIATPIARVGFLHRGIRHRTRSHVRSLHPDRARHPALQPPRFRPGRVSADALLLGRSGPGRTKKPRPS